MTLPEAIEVIRALVGPDAYYSITLDISGMSGSENRVSVVWKVYNGKRFHEGQTLAQAVESCQVAKAQGSSRLLAAEQAQTTLDASVEAVPQ